MTATQQPKIATPKHCDIEAIGQKWFDAWCMSSITIREAIAAGIKEGTAALAGELEASNSNHRARWIPFSERSPELNVKVLVFSPAKKGMVEICETSHPIVPGEPIWFPLSMGESVRLTHWMPLPAAPASDPQKEGGQ